jgi:hypothetical protein
LDAADEQDGAGRQPRRFGAITGFELRVIDAKMPISMRSGSAW